MLSSPTAWNRCALRGFGSGCSHFPCASLTVSEHRAVVPSDARKAGGAADLLKYLGLRRAVEHAVKREKLDVVEELGVHTAEKGHRAGTNVGEHGGRTLLPPHATEDAHRVRLS